MSAHVESRTLTAYETHLSQILLSVALVLVKYLAAQVRSVDR